MKYPLASIFILAFTSAPILFTFHGSGSGTVGAAPFQNAKFSITAIGDTDSRLQHTLHRVYWIEHISAQIDLDGIGVLSFDSPTRTYVNNESGGVGFSRGTVLGEDLYNSAINFPNLRTWNMLTSFGPLTTHFALMQ